MKRNTRLNRTYRPSLLAVSLAVALGLTSAGTTTAQQRGTPPIAPPPAQSPSLEERVVALKTSLAESSAKLRAYEWIETTVVSVKGEEKSSTM